MEVTPGYKQTEVGVIPEEWEVKPLTEIVSTPITDGPHLTPTFLNDGIPFLSVNNLVNNKLNLSSLRFVSRSDHEEFSKKCRPRRGDVLFGKAASVGQVALLDTDIELNIWSPLALIRVGHRASAQFVVYALQTRDVHRQIALLTNASSQGNIRMSDIGRIAIPVPSLSEQTAIAAALSDVDALLGGLDRLIAKKRDLKQAVTQQLLTGQTRLPGFRGEWEVKRLGEIGSTYGGLTGKTKADFGVGTGRYVTFMNVMTNVVIDCGLFEQVRVSPSESQNRVTEGDLLFNGSSETPEEVAMCSFMAGEASNLFLNSFCFGFRLHDKLRADGRFLAYYLRANPGRELMKSLAQGSTRYNLSKGALLDASIRLPHKGEQTAIAEVLSDMDAELAALEARRDKTRDLKQAMMQELLTGKTRLVSPEAAHA